MKEEMMTAGTGGFSGSAAATGPNAGYDPVIKFRKKVKDKKLVMPGNKIKAESARQILDEKLQELDEKLNKKLQTISQLRGKDNLNKKQQNKLDRASDKVGRVSNSIALTKINRLSNKDKPLTGAQSDKLDRLTNKVNKRANKALGKPLTSQQKTQQPLTGINAKSTTANSVNKAAGAGGVGPVQGNPTKAMNRFNTLMSKDELGTRAQNRLINKTAQVTRQDPNMKTASGKGAAQYVQNNLKSFPKGGPELGKKKSFYRNLDKPLTMNIGSGSSTTSTATTTPKNTGAGTSSSNYSLRAGKNRKFDSSGGRRNVSSYSGFTEAREAPCDRPSRLYQYKVTVPEMGTTIIYGSSPTELMVKFRMLFNPRFIKQIKIERVSPYQAGEIFYDKRMKHIRNIKPN